MKLHLTIILLLASFLLCTAQKQVIEIADVDKNIKESFTIVDDETGNLYLFLKSNSDYRCYLYNSNYELLGTLIQKELKRNKNDILGYSIFENNISIVMYSATSGEFGSLVFDFKTNSAEAIEYNFKLKRQFLVDSFIFENKTQVYTISKRKNELVVFVFDGKNQTPTEKTIAFQEDEFLDRRDRPTSIYNILTEITNGVPIINREFIDASVPNSIEKTSKTVKIYEYEEQCIVTSDRHDEFTYVLTIDPKKLQVTTKRMRQGELEGSRLGTKTNSYFQGGTLYQIAVNRDQLKIRMVDAESGELIKEKSTTKDGTIGYTNTPIYKAGKKEKSYDGPNRTAQFLRQMSDSDAGITVYEQDNIKQITFGAFSEKEPETAILVGAFLGGFGGALIGAAIGGTFSSFISYNNTNAVRAIGLFDASFNHLEGEVTKNPFDRIQRYVQIKGKIRSPTVFIKGNIYYFGSVDTNKSTYQIVQF